MAKPTRAEPIDAWRGHWRNVANAFAHPLTSESLLSHFVTNPNITGAYAEAWLRWMTRSMLNRYRISTGAIILPADDFRGLETVPQCDSIVWQPAELPALFEQGDFALVPGHSARAIIEIKRTCPDVVEFRKQLAIRRRRLGRRYQQNVLGVVLRHEARLCDGEVKPGWPASRSNSGPPAVTRLIDPGPRDVDQDGVFAFIYFLAGVAGYNKVF